MRSFWVWTRTQWRRKRGGALAATLMFALALGVVLTAAAGARRTQTAYPRMVEAVGASDVLANPDLGIDSELDFDAVKALPGVESVGVAAGMFVVPADVDGNPDFDLPLLALASTDGVIGYEVDRPLLEDGQLPDPDAIDEVVIDPGLAQILGVRAGETATFLVPDLSTPPAPGEDPAFVPLEMTVIGIGGSTSQILTDETFDLHQALFTPALFEAYPDFVGFWGLGVTLDDPSPEGVIDFRNAVDALVPDEGIEYRSQAVDNDAIRRAVEPQVAALYAFGALVGLAALVMLTQSLSRQLVLDVEETRTLQAVGLSRRTLFAGGMLRALLLGLLGAVAAIAIAIAASSRFPIGFVRNAEPRPGLAVNLGFLVGGAVLAVGLLLAVLALPIWRGSSLTVRSSTRSGTSVAARALRRWGAGPAVVTGVHFALEPPAGRSVSRTRSSLLGGVVVVAILAGAATFGTSLSHLVDTPGLYGWAWDASIDTNGRLPALEQALDADERVARWSQMTFNRLVLDGVPIPAVGVSPTTDAITPTIVEGHAPTSGDQIVLGGRTMRRLGTRIGGTVTTTSPAGVEQELEVVGQAAFPGLGTYSGSERTELGTGAMTTIRTLLEFGPEVDKGGVVVDLRPGADLADFRHDTSEALIESGADGDQIAVITSPRRPTDIVALGRVRRVPGTLAGLLAALLLMQLIVTLFAAGRGRGHDLALLKTIGFVRRQVASTVTWQTLTFAAIALVVGIPLGVALGRALWTALADRLGVVPDLVTPLVGLVLLAAAILAGGALISYTGGALLARTPPATSLRSE